MIRISGTNVTIMVKDIDASIIFYENMGLTPQNHWENHYAMISSTGITIGIHPAGNETDLNSGTTSIGFMLNKLDMKERFCISLNQNGKTILKKSLHITKILNVAQII